MSSIFNPTYWPVNVDGQIPLALFDQQALGDALFINGTREWKCTRRAIRQAMKALAKHHRVPIPDYSREMDIEERDRRLAWAVCSSAEARKGFADLEILEDERSGPRGRRKRFVKVQEFARTIWNLLIRGSESEAIASLADWSLEYAKRIGELGPGKYLDADALRSAIATSECPVSIESLPFCRNVVLFAALLPADQRLDLISAAISLGASPLKALLNAESSTSAEIAGEVEALPVTREAPLAPRLVVPVEIPTISIQQASEEMKELKRFLLLQEKDQSLETEAKLVFGTVLSRLVQQPAPEFARSVALLNNVYQARIDLSIAKQELETAIHRAVESVAQALEITVAAPVPTAEAASEATSVLVAARKFERRMFAVVDWLRQLPNPVSLTQLLALPRLIAGFHAKERAKKEFVAQALEYVARTSSTELANWIMTLQGDEIFALVGCDALAKWSVPSAVLLRIGLDKRDPALVREITEWLVTVDEIERRRDLLRFLDPASSNYDFDRRLRRIVVVERLRELITKGPLAAITDQSLGFTDPSIVGRSVASIINVISAHLGDIQSAGDIASLLTAESPRAYTSEKLISFIRSPATLTGHFKKLREIARESLLMPVIASGGVDLSAVRKLIEVIESGDALNRVISDFHKSDITNAKLDTRHETQLVRYLRHARDLLVQIQQSNENRPLARKEALRQELKHLISGLSPSGAIGEEEWVEAELKSLLADPYITFANPTLLGRQSTANEIIWTLDDTLWARAEMDLAPFYEQSQTIVDISAASLKVAAVNRAPTPSELADELASRGHFKVALELLKERSSDESVVRALRQQIDETIAPRVARVNAKLSDLASRYGRLSRESDYFRSLTTALKSRDIAGAEECVELLALELADAKSTADEALVEAQTRSAVAALQKRLLDAGVAPQEEAELRELEERWTAEWERRADERVHLDSAVAIFDDFDVGSPVFASFIPHLEAFKAGRQSPSNWLRADRSTELAEYLRPSNVKLAAWAGAATFSTPQMQRALIVIFEVHLQFILGQVQNIRSLDAGSSIDGVLEHVIEYADAVKSATDPLACIAALREIGELKDDRDWDALTQPALVLAPDRVNARISEALAMSDWRSAAALARTARATVSDDLTKRLDEVVDFANTMLAIDGQSTVAAEMLESSARILVTAGHPVNRALPARTQLTFAFRLINYALASDTQVDVAAPSSTRLFGVSNELPSDLFKVINETGRFPSTGRVLELLLTGTLASDLSERIWSLAIGHNDQIQYRTEFLRFLNDHGCQEAIVRLAGRFDPGIKIKLEQLMDLRAAAAHRIELYPAADALAGVLGGSAKSAPFRLFVKKLPTIGQVLENAIEATIEEDLIVRDSETNSPATVHVAILVRPRGMVPELLQAQLSSEDDVVFAGKRARVVTLSNELMYVPTPFSVEVELGESWRSDRRKDELARFRLRLSARTITQELVTCDVDCNVRKVVRRSNSGSWLDNDSILDFYPGVGSTPAEGANFIGRSAEIEQLQTFLIGARQPTPILLTGMRRIGKTSLLYAFHQRHRVPGQGEALTIYLSIAEQRSAFLASERSVADTLFRAIVRAIAKPYFPSSDHNKIVGERLKNAIGGERNAVRVALEKAHDPDSFSDSLMVLSEQILVALGVKQRVIFLVDEAETLIVPYNQGGEKKVQLEQLLQSLREVSQTTSTVGLVLSGSNHIVEFAREYKNAFFGSCARIDLAGITAYSEAEKIIAPQRIRPFVQFDVSAIEYGVSLCAGMPQFMWQVGAATAALVRSGPATRGDVRSSVSALVNERGDDLPFKPYDVLEPLEHMLSLHGARERDLLWLLLRRVALNSSLANAHVSRHFIIEQSLLELGSKDEWNRRLGVLVDLDILTVPQPQSYAFKVPIFAEAFRASRNNHEQSVRLQRVSL